MRPRDLYLSGHACALAMPSPAWLLNHPGGRTDVACPLMKDRCDLRTEASPGLRHGNLEPRVGQSRVLWGSGKAPMELGL